MQLNLEDPLPAWVCSARSAIPSINQFNIRCASEIADHLTLRAGDSHASTSGRLEEPLLAPEDRSDDYDSASHSAGGKSARGRPYRGHERSDRALVPHSVNRINWEELWRVLWGNCCSSWSGILGETLEHTHTLSLARCVFRIHLFSPRKFWMLAGHSALVVCRESEVSHKGLKWFMVCSNTQQLPSASAAGAAAPGAAQQHSGRPAGRPASAHRSAFRCRQPRTHCASFCVLQCPLGFYECLAFVFTCSTSTLSTAAS